MASIQPTEPPKAKAPLAAVEDQSDAAIRLGRLYFGNVVEDGVGAIQPWPDDEQVVIEQPGGDPDLKKSAMATPASADFNFETASMPQEPGVEPMPPEVFMSGETVAAKGEVTGAGQAAADAGRAAQPRRQSRAPRPRSAWPRRSISRRAASPSAARSRSPRW